jgi:transcriptional regulator with XRE-family HTH domain
METQEIGKQLKERRTVLHLHQKDLSEMSGVSLRTIIQVENGVGNPALKTLQKLAEVLGMEILLTIKTK